MARTIWIIWEWIKLLDLHTFCDLLYCQTLLDNLRYRPFKIVPSEALRMYNHRADYRSWESTKLFLHELFMGLPSAARGPENDDLETSMQNYTCNTTTCGGYLAKNKTCTATNKCPAVVVIQDWTGMDDYEKERSRMLAELGYVAFAADIYGYGTPAENMAQWGAAAGAHRGNPDLYMSKIQAALDQVKTYDFVDTTKIAAVGYCFGGSGVVNMAILGVDVLGVVGYHSGIQTTSRVVWDSVTNNAAVKAKVLLHSGVDDDAATDVALLEQEFEAAGATYEIVRYGKDIFHSFTEWSAAFPGQAMLGCILNWLQLLKTFSLLAITY